MNSERLAELKAQLGITPETELAKAKKAVEFLRKALPRAEERLARAQEAYDEWRQADG